MIKKELLQEVEKRVNAESCLNDSDLADLYEMMLNDLVRYHLNDVLTENNLIISNKEFDILVSLFTGTTKDTTVSILLGA